jgi:hypothetical protein
MRTTSTSQEAKNYNYALQLDRKRTTMAPIIPEAVPTPAADLSTSETGHYKRIFTLFEFLT